MADKLSLQLEQRTLIGKQVNQLRRAGLLPMTVYGKGVGPFAVQVNARVFADVLRRAGQTRLVELAIPGQQVQSAFIHMVQRHPVTRNIIHADLLVVDLRTEVTVEVPVRLIGEAPVAQRGDGVVNHLLTTLEVRTLPADVPAHIDVDLSVLEGLDVSIRARDLTVPAGVTIVAPEDAVVVSVSPARAEEEEVVEEATPAEPELVREQRDEEES